MSLIVVADRRARVARRRGPGPPTGPCCARSSSATIPTPPASTAASTSAVTSARRCPRPGRGVVVVRGPGAGRRTLGHDPDCRRLRGHPAPARLDPRRAREHASPRASPVGHVGRERRRRQPACPTSISASASRQRSERATSIRYLAACPAAPSRASTAAERRGGRSRRPWRPRLPPQRTRANAAGPRRAGRLHGADRGPAPTRSRRAGSGPRRDARAGSRRSAQSAAPRCSGLAGSCRRHRADAADAARRGPPASIRPAAVAAHLAPRRRAPSRRRRRAPCRFDSDRAPPRPRPRSTAARRADGLAESRACSTPRSRAADAGSSRSGDGDGTVIRARSDPDGGAARGSCPAPNAVSRRLRAAVGFLLCSLAAARAPGSRPGARRRGRPYH